MATGRWLTVGVRWLVMGVRWLTVGLAVCCLVGGGVAWHAEPVDEVEQLAPARRHLLLLPIRNLDALSSLTVDSAEMAEVQEEFAAALFVTERFDLATGLSRTRAQYGAVMSVHGWRRVGQQLRPRSVSFQAVDTNSQQVLFALHLGLPDVGLPNVGRSQGKGAALNAGCASQSACIAHGVDRLTAWLAEQPWSAVVRQVAGDRVVVVDAGQQHGVEPGMELVALMRRESWIDPETGESLGAATERCGKLLITAVDEDTSVAMVVESCEGLKPGDRLEVD